MRGINSRVSSSSDQQASMKWRILSKSIASKKIYNTISNKNTLEKKNKKYKKMKLRKENKLSFNQFKVNFRQIIG